MRLWHYAILPYLPDRQFKGQLRELVAIMRDWRDKGKTNHVLINMIMEYEKEELVRYAIYYEALWHERYGKYFKQTQWEEFKAFAESQPDKKKYYSDGWHNDEYLRICMANLYEKHRFGIGKSRITDSEWEVILRGYKTITGEDWVL